MTFSADLQALIPHLRRFAFSLCKNAAEAEDLTQDALERAWKYRDKFQAGTNLRAWVFFILKNRFRSKRRRSWRQVDVYDDAVRLLAVADRPDSRMGLAELLDALSYLPDAQAEAVMAIAVDGLSYEEAADDLHCEVGTIKSRVCRARKELVTYFGA